MEITQALLKTLKDAIPGNYALYQVSERRLLQLLRSDSLPVLSGLTAEEYDRLIAGDAAKIVMEYDKGHIAAVLTRLLSDGGDADFSYRILHKGMPFVWVRAFARVIGEKDGQPVIMVVFHEIGTKNMEFVVDHIPVGVGVCTVINGEITPTAINQKMIELLGTTSELFTHSDHAMLANVHPEDAKAAMRVMSNCAAPGFEGRLDYRYRPAGKGNWLWYRLIIRTVPYGGGSMAFVCLLDVTAEKAAAIEAVKSRSMYLTAAAESGIIIWEYQPATHRITMQINNDYTKETCQEYGIPEIVENGPETLSAVVSESDRPAFLEMYRKIDAGACRASCEVGMHLGDRLFYWKIICATVCDRDDKLLAVFCTGQDVTARYEAQERFRNAFEEILAAYPNSIGTFRHNLTTNWTGGGQGVFSARFGEAARGTVDRHVAALVATMESEDDKKFFLEHFSRESLLQAFDRGQSHLAYEYPIILEGRRRWVRCVVNMLRNPSTGDVEALALASDITEEKKREAIEKLVTEEEFDYVGILNLADEQLELYNKRSDVAFPDLRQRVSYADCVSYVGSHFVSESERGQFETASNLQNVIAALERTGSYEASYLRGRNGTVTRRELRFRWFDRAAREVLMMRTDVTAAYEQEQRQLQAVQAALEQAKKANAAKSEFLSQISHDMRTPLNGIIGMTYLTRKMELPSSACINLEKIENSSKFLLGLINDVLDMAKAESGKIALRPEPYSIDEFAQYVDAVIRPLCAEKNQELLTEYDMPAGCVPLVDKLRVNQIVFNLLSNAVKYSPEGSQITYRDRSTLLPDGRVRDRIEVQDHGIGMSDKFQRVLFEPFMQENRIDNSEMRGSGLGLSITKKLVDAMGGAIQVESQIGRGTTILVELIFDRASVSHIEHQKKRSGNAPADYPLAGKHLLLCEDHPLNQEIAKALLVEQGASVDIADDGAAGLKLFENSSVGYFDCILMDIRMPIMDGYEATKAIRALSRPDAAAVPVLAMTADAFSDDVQKCYDAGMNGHIAKPVDPALLFSALSKAIT